MNAHRHGQPLILHALLVALAVVAGLAGCRNAAAPDAVTRSTVGDTTFISSPPDGIDGPVTLTEQLRVTADQLDVGSFFAAAFGPDGTIWLYDRRGRNGEVL